MLCFSPRSTKKCQQTRDRWQIHLDLNISIATARIQDLSKRFMENVYLPTENKKLRSLK